MVCIYVFFVCVDAIPPMSCTDPESFARGWGGGGGSKFDHVFFWSIVDEDIEDPNAALNGPSLARKRNNI